MFAEVKSTSRLTPSMIRVVLHGGGLHEFASTGYTDEYINAQFVPEGAPYSVPFDTDDVEAAGADFRPRPRRFTVREWNEASGELTIDFVAHGDVGYAGRWAQRARPGDRLQFKGPGGGYAPDPHADWHLMVGDESALPAIAASVARLDPGRPCTVVAVVDGPDDELPLTGPGELTVIWCHRQGATEPDDLLRSAVARLDFRPGRADIFVHGEAAEVRSIRRHLRDERGLDLAGASISPYWRRDHSDEAWRQIKRAWMAEEA